MWSSENVVLDLNDKKKQKTYFYGIFAFILIGQLSDCNSEIQTCNSEFFSRNCKFTSHNSGFLKIAQYKHAILTFFLKIVRYELSIVSYKVQFLGEKIQAHFLTTARLYLTILALQQFCVIKSKLQDIYIQF